ncbi:hypothetical protein N2K95_08505 [Arthrobacter zhaoxinii]|uniref:Lipoprotein n=1 Tax=Arthrobacter zhaoxinii TaxID=2964616 RepID=A0ABY5YNE1_9MICC|nr:hypothetical protein [Arthrobacter zhaoxinii]UWX95746.1 hypothetical protein N2K95_08505 [Arthrobacter zhaoxinii]
MESRARTRPGKLLALCTGLLLTVSACGPTAQQLQEREASASASPSGTRTVPTAPSRSAVPSPPPSPPVSEPAAPPRVGVTGSQTGMPQPVQDSCQWLLRRDPEPMSGAEAGACVSAAMAAGEGGIQTLQTETSWLPAGTYSVRFATAPGFAMTLQGMDEDLAVNIRDGKRVLRKNGKDISADPKGSAEAAYAAVLADAAELTVRPEKLAALLAPAAEVAVRYGAVLEGEAYTQISGSFDTADTGPVSGQEPDSSAVLPAGSFSLYLDDYYRPVRIEISGLNQGITSTITAVNAQWGTRP